MLIKEYRIPLPLSVEEYRIAQLYMIQKKSREESSGSGSGVEILINEPYTDGPGGNGQYTHKIYHVGSHLPGWFRAILPKSALQVEEEAWNAYPYTKTIFRCPFIEKFSLEVETVYKNDGGTQENIFNLTKSEQRGRTVDIIDIVKDPISSGDYRREEDPKLFVSEFTNRGPLDENWRQDYIDNGKTIMCAYKLCKVEFRYWGMQSKIERFIHDVAMRKTMLRAHRQAWSWQDEYHGLSMEDIRELERQTQEALQQRMAALAEEQEGQAGDTPPPAGVVSLPSQETPFRENIPRRNSEDDTLNTPEVLGKNLSKGNSLSSVDSDHRKQSWSSSRSRQMTGSLCKLANWRVESIEQLASSSDDEDEFFDANDDMEALYKSNPQLFRSTSMEMLTEEEYTDSLPPPSGLNEDDIDASHTSPLGRRLEQYQKLQQVGGNSLDIPCTPITPGTTTGNCKTTLLFILLHGGSVMDTGLEHTLSKHSDLTTFKSTLRATIAAHYPTMQNHVAVRLVSCPPICSEALQIMASLNPFSFDAASPTLDTSIVTNENFPVGAISIFATGSPDYYDAVVQVIAKANKTFHDFLQSEDGQGFNGQVCLVGDCIGSIIGYDALCKNNPFLHGGNNYYGSSEVLTEGSGQTDNVHGKGQSTLETIKQTSLSNPDLTVLVTEESSENSVQKRKLKSSNVNGTPGQEGSSHHHSRPLAARHASCPASRRTSSGSQSEVGKFEFEVTDFFMFGSPLALVLAYRRLSHSNEKSNLLPRPSCHQIYNLFYPSDPSATRIEPLLHDKFKLLPPFKVPRYQKFPLGDGHSVHVVETIQSNAQVLLETSVPGSAHSYETPAFERRASNMSITSQMSGHGEISATGIATISNRWWGNKRIDYALYCPDALQNFPNTALPYLLHASFWESTDVASFMLRQVVRHEDLATSCGGQDSGLFKPSQPREKWLKRRTTIKLRNVAPNHRANDVIVLEDRPQMLTARFMYGPLDMVSLSGEKVDVHIMMKPPNVEWTYFGTEVTDGTGRAMYEIPAEKRLPQGMYPVKMVVRGDHTVVDFYLTVLPPRTDTVVFSIDGSFTASVSIMGKDPKVRPGAVDVVRHWQDLGYLILYISARPDMQQNKVVAWLAQHNFPHGMVAFMDGLSADPLRQKANYLKALTQEAGIHVAAAYGSSKDIYVYQNIGTASDSIFIVGKASKKQHKDANIISDGYAAHLNDLTSAGGSRPAQGNARLFLRKSCFSLPGQNKSGSKKPIRKTVSLPQRAGSFRGDSPCSLMGDTPAIAVSESGNTVVDQTPSLRARGMSPRGKIRADTRQAVP